MKINKKMSELQCPLCSGSDEPIKRGSVQNGYWVVRGCAENWFQAFLYKILICSSKLLHFPAVAHGNEDAHRCAVFFFFPGDHEADAEDEKEDFEAEEEFLERPRGVSHGIFWHRCGTWPLWISMN